MDIDIEEILQNFIKYMMELGVEICYETDYHYIKVAKYKGVDFLISKNESEICFSVFTDDKKKLKKILKILSKFFKEKPLIKEDKVNKITSFIFSK